MNFELESRKKNFGFFVWKRWKNHSCKWLLVSRSIYIQHRCIIIVILSNYLILWHLCSAVHTHNVNSSTYQMSWWWNSRYTFFSCVNWKKKKPQQNNFFFCFLFFFVFLKKLFYRHGKIQGEHHDGLRAAQPIVFCKRIKKNRRGL